MFSKHRSAIALPALLLGLSMPAWAADTSGQGTSDIHPPTHRMDKAVSPQQNPAGDDFKPEVSEASSESSLLAMAESETSRHPNPQTLPPTTTMDKALSPQRTGDQPKAADEPTTIGPQGEAVD